MQGFIMKKLRYLFLFLVTCWGCSKESASGEPGGGIRVLFVGNSLTYTNNIPAMVKELADKDAVSVSYETILLPDYGLDDHLSDGKVQKEIKKGRYDYVVVQQGPSALAESQAMLMASVKKYKALCDEAKTKLALYMVWPSKARLFDLDNVIYSYSNAAVKNGAMICAAGLAWKNVWATNSSIALYGPDGFHPDITGSLLSAMVIYGTLTGKKEFDLQNLEKGSWAKGLSNAVLTVLRKAAIEAIETKFG